MRYRLLGAALGVLLCVLGTSARAQWLNYPTRGIPRRMSDSLLKFDGSPN